MQTNEINWGYNCLTQGVHHGRPETIWNLPLIQASFMFTDDELKMLVVARIYNDAMQFVESSPFEQKGTGATFSFKPEWAEEIKKLAEEGFDKLYQLKLGEMHMYYQNPNWRKDVLDVLKRVQDNKLNPHHKPLHSHDSINLLCRILGVGCSIEASK